MQSVQRDANKGHCKPTLGVRMVLSTGAPNTRTLFENCIDRQTIHTVSHRTVTLPLDDLE